MGLFKEFGDFVKRGNVMDLAVGVIIGAAFGKIIGSLVADVIMPPIGMALGNVDFKDLSHVLQQAVPEVKNGAVVVTPAKAEIVLRYGAFIQTVIDFLIVAFCVFMAVRTFNKMKHKEAPAPAATPTTKDCPHCLTAIPIKATKCGHCTSDLR
jgi:large conductance mechanosensitive channel